MQELTRASKILTVLSLAQEADKLQDIHSRTPFGQVFFGNVNDVPFYSGNPLALLSEASIFLTVPETHQQTGWVTRSASSVEFGRLGPP
jgi:hypothetical protein